MTVLSILPWNTCNAHCAHCGPQSGPRDKTRISRAEILELINQAANLYSTPTNEWCFSLSGGEVFLHYDELLEYCQFAKARGGYTTLITNCFWATSVEKAEKLLMPLKQANLQVLGASVGEFHRQFIPLERVANAIKAARNIGVKPHIRMASTKNVRMWHILRDLAEYELWFIDFMEMPVTPAGRAEFDINADALYLKPGLPQGGCPAASLTINPKGDAMVCCNGAGEYGLDVGNIRDATYGELENRIKTSLFMDFLVKFGPVKLVDFLEPKEIAYWEKKSYVSTCHLCFELIKDKERHQRLRAHVDKWYSEKIHHWMPQLRELLVENAI